jgi:hypothetical protein
LIEFFNWKKVVFVALLKLPTRLPDGSWSKHTKTRKIYQMTTNYAYLVAKNLPNGRKIFQMVIKYNNILHSKALQNLPKCGFLV